MTDYSKLKNAELEILLKQRNLPHTGKKADMVARLQEADKKDEAGGADADADAKQEATPVANTNAAPAEDEIDWDDDTVDATKVTEATSAPAAAAVAAGGQGRVANPRAVPNQVASEEDPATTNDLTTRTSEESSTANGVPQLAQTGQAKAEEKEPVSFSRGLAETTLDEELEKRKARAKKFGLPQPNEEEVKKVDRAKKFGEAAAAPKGLNEALPERRERKRVREAGDEGGRDGQKRGGRRPDAKRGDRRNDKRSNLSDERAENRGSSAAPRGGGGAASWMSEKDRTAAEARKARFSATQQSS